MGVPKSVQDLYGQFKTEFAKNGPNSEPLLGRLKVELAKIGNQLILQQEKDVVTLGREVYECGAFLAIRKNDVAGFERNVKQLKIYYRDFDKVIGVGSSNELKIFGLYLLSLLASDRIGEFHTELELLDATQRSSQFIANPVKLERYLMEGNYAKIREALTLLNSQEYYKVFLSQLLNTMRRRIVDSLQRTANAIQVSTAQKMLYLDSATELEKLIKELQQESDEAETWVIKGDQLIFRLGAATESSIPAYDTISNVIGYATEIERIV